MPTVFNLSYQFPNHPTAAQRVDITYAVDQWAAVLVNHDLEINVRVWGVDMSGTPLNAMCVPAIFQTANTTLTRPQAKRNGDTPPNDPGLDLILVIDTVTPWILRPNIPAHLEYSLATTAMHELCHGLGFLSLCNVDDAAETGTYTDSINLIAILNHYLALMNPNVVVPADFLPAHPLVGIAVATPFANLFNYMHAHFVRGNAADDFDAFTTEGAIRIPLHGLAPITLFTGHPFFPFTTCDHITGGAYLMNPSTVGQNHDTPDGASRDILRAIGWDPVFPL